MHQKSKSSVVAKERCEYCQKEFSKYALIQHRKIHLPQTEFKCSFCDYTTNFKYVLFRHIRTHTQERPYKCQQPNCNWAFTDVSALRIHKLVHKKQDDTLKKFKCPNCPYKTAVKGRLSAHMITHSEVKQFSCDLCPYQGKSKARVQTHKQTVHVAIRLFKCQEPNCNSSFVAKSNLKQHQSVHRKDDESLLKFKCPSCDYKTAHKANLPKHLKRHSVVKPFVCGLCPFKSKHQISVKRHHESIHSAPQPFKCSNAGCSFSCKFNSTLIRHLETHGAAHKPTNRPHKCTLCTFASAKNGKLFDHIRSCHTGEAPYACQSCRYRTKSSSSLASHVKSQHQGIAKKHGDEK